MRCALLVATLLTLSSPVGHALDRPPTAPAITIGNDNKLAFARK